MKAKSLVLSTNVLLDWGGKQYVLHIAEFIAGQAWKGLSHLLHILV